MVSDLVIVGTASAISVGGIRILITTMGFWGQKPTSISQVHLYVQLMHVRLLVGYVFLWRVRVCDFVTTVGIRTMGHISRFADKPFVFLELVVAVDLAIIREIWVVSDKDDVPVRTVVNQQVTRVKHSITEVSTLDVSGSVKV